MGLLCREMADRYNENNQIDIHTHITPNVDDGSSSIEMSLDMLRSEVDEITRWLTGYPDLDDLNDKTYGEFIAGCRRGTPALSILQGRFAACRWRRLRTR